MRIRRSFVDFITVGALALGLSLSSLSSAQESIGPRDKGPDGPLKKKFEDLKDGAFAGGPGGAGPIGRMGGMGGGPGGPGAAPSSGSGGGSGSGEEAGALVLFDTVQVTLSAQVAEIYDPLLGGDGGDHNTSLWFDSNYGRWSVGMGLGYDRYRIEDRYQIDTQTYTTDFYALYNLVDNLHIGGFVNLSYVHLRDATFTIEDTQVTVGDESLYYGAGILASYSYTWQEYTFGVNSTLASMLNDKAGDLFDGEEAQWYTGASLYRPITSQLAAEAFVGWTYYFERLGGRDEAYGTVGIDILYTINSHWSASLGLETDFAQDNYEARFLNASVTYEF